MKTMSRDRSRVGACAIIAAMSKISSPALASYASVAVSSAAASSRTRGSSARITGPSTEGASTTVFPRKTRPNMLNISPYPPDRSAPP